MFQTHEYRSLSRVEMRRFPPNFMFTSKSSPRFCPSKNGTNKRIDTEVMKAADHNRITQSTRDSWRVSCSSVVAAFFASVALNPHLSPFLSASSPVTCRCHRRRCRHRRRRSWRRRRRLTDLSRRKKEPSRDNAADSADTTVALVGNVKLWRRDGTFPRQAVKQSQTYLLVLSGHNFSRRPDSFLLLLPLSHRLP